MDVLRAGLGLVESPRWHEGRLWFSDWIAGEIIAIDDTGVSELIVRHESLPLCFAFPEHANRRGISKASVVRYTGLPEDH